LGWFTDVPISIKDKDGKTVTATGNFTRIDNGEPELIQSTLSTVTPYISTPSS